MIEHHIQKDILLRLSKAPVLRFSELKPESIESNSFMYHLRQLQAQKLVDKTDAGYQLSDGGLSNIDGFSFNTLQPRKQPKLISILVIRSSDGKLLMGKRKYQPYIGQYAFVSGKQHLGESPEDHYKREQREKLGLAIPMTRRGLADIRILHGETVITHVTAHIYEGSLSDSTLPPDSHQYEYAWVDPHDSETRMLGGTREIIEQLELKSPELFFLSLDVQDD